MASSAGAEPDDFAFADAVVRGDFAVSGLGLSGIYLPPAAGTFTWNLSAAALIVNWTRHTYWEQGRPTDPSRAGWEVETGPPTSGEDSFGSASVVSASSSSESNLLAVVPKGQAIEPQIRAGTGFLRAAQNVSWMAGREASSDAPSPNDPTSFLYPMPAQRAEATILEGYVVVRGTFSLFVWGADVAVTSEEATHTYGSGSWVSKAPFGKPWVAWERTYQLLRLDVMNGELRLTLEGRAATAVAEEYVIQGRLNLTFSNATGVLPSPIGGRVVRDEGVQVEGEGRLAAWNWTESQSRLAGRLDWIAEAVEGERSPGNAGPVLTPSGRTPQVPAPRPGGIAAPWFLSILAAALLTSAGYAAIRMEPPRPDLKDVEWALLTSRPARARRWARRLVAREPQNADAVFLYGSALLANDEYSEILRKVEPLAKALPVHLRAGSALVIAASAKRVGDMPRAGFWAREAAREPFLHRQMKSEGGWEALLCPGNDPSVAYA